MIRYTSLDHRKALNVIEKLIDEPRSNICTWAVVAVTLDNRVIVGSPDIHDVCVQSILIDGLACLNDQIRDREV